MIPFQSLYLIYENFVLFFSIPDYIYIILHEMVKHT